MQQFFKDYLERLTIYHQDFAATFAGLPQEALDWVPGKEMNSFCVLVVHTMGAERYFLSDVISNISSNRVRANEFVAKGLDEAALKQRLDETLDFARTVLEKLSVEQLGDARVSPQHPNEAFTVGSALLRTIAHTGLHVGHAQITRQLWDQRK